MGTTNKISIEYTQMEKKKGTNILLKTPQNAKEGNNAGKEEPNTFKNTKNKKQMAEALPYKYLLST